MEISLCEQMANQSVEREGNRLSEEGKEMRAHMLVSVVAYEGGIVPSMQ